MAYLNTLQGQSNPAQRPMFRIVKNDYGPPLLGSLFGSLGKIRLPHLAMPHLSMPHLSMPHIRLPHIKPPHLSMPHISPPKFKINTSGIGKAAASLVDPLNLHTALPNLVNQAAGALPGLIQTGLLPLTAPLGIAASLAPAVLQTASGLMSIVPGMNPGAGPGGMGAMTDDPSQQQMDPSMIASDEPIPPDPTSSDYDPTLDPSAALDPSVMNDPSNMVDPTAYDPTQDPALQDPTATDPNYIDPSMMSPDPSLSGSYPRYAPGYVKQQKMNWSSQGWGM